MLTMEVMRGVAHELGFWKGFVNDPRFVNGWIPSDVKTPDLQPEIYDFFRALPNFDQLKVLDLGSGVLSVLNGTFSKENITAVDPLGALYPFVFDYTAHGFSPPIPCGGEEIDFVSAFDIVHISNAIDHSQQPNRVFEKMMLAAKPGGLVVVQGLVDEALHENWEGFHQWNFKMDPVCGQVSYTGKSGQQFDLHGDQVFKVLKRFPHVGRDWFISVWRR